MSIQTLRLYIVQSIACSATLTNFAFSICWLISSCVIRAISASVFPFPPIPVVDLTKVIMRAVYKDCSKKVQHCTVFDPKQYSTYTRQYHYIVVPRYPSPSNTIYLCKHAQNNHRHTHRVHDVGLLFEVCGVSVRSRHVER